MNIDTVSYFFHRLDSEGAYDDRARLDVEGAYVPEREEILEAADRIEAMYKALYVVK